jgi:hypothetical protein
MAAKRTRRWSQNVTEGSNALDPQRGVSTLRSPRRIAPSLKRSAERSHRRKSAPYRFAMLTFYLNRAGRDLPASRRKVLNEERAAPGVRRQARDQAQHQPETQHTDIAIGRHRATGNHSGA